MFNPQARNARPMVHAGLTYFPLMSCSGETPPPIGDEPYTSPGDLPVEQPVPDPGPQDAMRPSHVCSSGQRLPMSSPSSR